MVTASDFVVLAAIDLRRDRVVRLEQGDFGRATAFSDDPVATARTFVDAGASWLHVVDLDGARVGQPRHGEVIAGIIEAVGDVAAVEVAGGLRDAAAVERALASGARRVVLGTAALQEPAFAAHLVADHGPDRIAVAIDVRDGTVVGHGWSATTPTYDIEAATSALAASGVRTFEVTAIERDGLLGGPDLTLYGRLVSLRIGSIVASGGIRGVADIRDLRAIGCDGAIVGRALYDGGLSVTAAVAAASEAMA